MVHRIRERPSRRADDAVGRQFGLKGLVFCLSQGEIPVVERRMPVHKIGEQELIGGDLTGETDASGSWGKMARTAKIRLAMGGIPPLIPGPEGIDVRLGPLSNASLHLLGHPLIGGTPLPRLINEVGPRTVKEAILLELFPYLIGLDRPDQYRSVVFRFQLPPVSQIGTFFLLEQSSKCFSLVIRECLGVFLLKGRTILKHMLRMNCQMVDFTNADTH